MVAAGSGVLRQFGHTFENGLFLPLPEPSDTIGRDLSRRHRTQLVRQTQPAWGAFQSQSQGELLLGRGLWVRIMPVPVLNPASLLPTCSALLRGTQPPARTSMIQVRWKLQH